MPPSFRPAASDTSAPIPLVYDLTAALTGKASEVLAGFKEGLPARVAWLIVLEGEGVWDYGRRRHWLTAGSILFLDLRAHLPPPPRRKPPECRVALLAYAGEAAVRHGELLQRHYGALQICEAEAAPVRAAQTLATSAGTLDGWGRERSGGGWIAEWHRYLYFHRPPLTTIFSLPAGDLRLLAFAGRTVKDFERETGFSRSYLTRKFVLAWNEPPSAVLRKLRLEKAAHFLRATTLDVATVATAAGFASTSGFLSAFRKSYGTTPAAYRAKSGPASAPAVPVWTLFPLPTPRPPRQVSTRASGVKMGDAVQAPDWDGPYFRLLTCGESSEPNRSAFEVALSVLVERRTLVITLEGEAVFETRDRSIRVSPGVAVAYPVPMNARWRSAPGGRPWRRLWLQFHGPLAQAFFDETVARHGNVQQIDPDGDLVSRTRELADLVRSVRAEPAVFWSQQAHRWLLEWRRYLEHGYKPGDRVLHFIDPAARRLRRLPKSLADYAAQIGYSRSFVSQRLKAQWHITPGRVLRAARLDHAAHLLRTTKESVASIAKAAGYATPSAFILAFKRRERVTPLAYRHSHRA